MSEIVSLLHYPSENLWLLAGQVLAAAFAATALARGSWRNLATIARGAGRVQAWALAPSRTTLLEEEIRRLKTDLGVTIDAPVTGASTQGTLSGAAAGLYPSDGQRRATSRG